MQVTFHGVRGSTPCPGGTCTRYGGNTSCVVVDVDGEAPFVFDLGTGLRSWGDTQPLDGTFRAHAFVTHFHFDHIQGLPFLAAADRVGAEFNIYGPGLTGHDVVERWTELIRPPWFPVEMDQLRGTYTNHDVCNADFSIGRAKVRVRAVPHVGLTLGYRIDGDGTSVAYVPDHQAPQDLIGVADSVIELCEGVDLLIHDAQYTDNDWLTKSQWGHCTVKYAVDVAIACKARALALFHHDPARSDAEVDELLAIAARRASPHGIDVVAAAEGLQLRPGRQLQVASTKRVHLGPMFRSSHR